MPDKSVDKHGNSLRGTPPRWCGFLRRYYHRSRWLVFQGITGGRAGKTQWIAPVRVRSGQLPCNQFARRPFRFVRHGNWDLEVIDIEEHSVFRSMRAHFVEGVPWERTPHYHEALEKIRSGTGFRGEYSLGEIQKFFEEWENLHHQMRAHGFRSMADLYRLGLMDNPCKRLDEITVNLSRDGTPILNDGWHRFCLARILEIPEIPVRVQARHPLYPHWHPASTGRDML